MENDGGGGPPHVAFSRIQGVGGQKFFVVTRWFKDHFSIHVTNGPGVWAAGEVKRPQRQKHVLDDTEWLALARRALSREAVLQVPSMTYELEAEAVGEGELEVRWMEVDAEGDGFGMCGICRLPPSPEAMPVLLDSLFDQTQQLQSSVSSLAKDTEELVSLLAQSRAAEQKILAAKSEVEGELYKRFKVLINEKKRKARELRDELEAGDRDDSDGDHSQQHSDGEQDDDDGGYGISPVKRPEPRRRARPPQ